MVRLAIAMIAVICVIALSGCGNLSPRINPELEQQLEELKGNQNTLENNQNAIKIELGRLQNALEIQGENNEVQQGWLNIQADGILIGVFGIGTIGLLLFYMYKSSKYKKVSTILADQVRMVDDWDLKDDIMAAAWNTEVEKTVYKMIK